MFDSLGEEGWGGENARPTVPAECCSQYGEELLDLPSTGAFNVPNSSAEQYRPLRQDRIDITRRHSFAVLAGAYINARRKAR